MIQLVGGAAAIVIDTVSYMASAIAVLLIHKPEPKPAPTRFDAEKSGVLAELREGLDAVFGNPIIRHAVSCAATSNLGTNMIFAVELIFMYRRLQLSPAVVGTILAVGSVGGILGALAASSIARRLGVGWTIIVSIFFGEFGLLALLILISGYFIAQFATPVYNITSVRLRQAIAPDRLQDRMNATARHGDLGHHPPGHVHQRNSRHNNRHHPHHPDRQRHRGEGCVLGAGSPRAQPLYPAAAGRARPIGPGGGSGPQLAGADPEGRGADPSKRAVTAGHQPLQVEAGDILDRGAAEGDGRAVVQLRLDRQ